MSRIGKMPVVIPPGVDVETSFGYIKAKGPMGEADLYYNQGMTVKIEDGVLTVQRPDNKKQNKALHGLTRKLIFNLVTGVHEGFVKELQIVGVGYRATKQDNTLVLNLGYSHLVEMDDPEGVTTTVEGNNRILVRGINKQKVGQHAANIRKKRPPEPYKGKGIRYANETIKLKVGKAG
ncbi:MAG: 50S ribosomal protein L6 [Eubacteriaceae bacterium]|nr:50S ribosomal protein L6 [Eubacteriaceae bacterium]